MSEFNILYFRKVMICSSFSNGILHSIFSHCGEIKYAEMKERGTGLVRFINERDAERAMSEFIHCTVIYFFSSYSFHIILPI